MPEKAIIRKIRMLRQYQQEISNQAAAPTEEVWRDVPGYEGLYQVSNYGRVKSLGRAISKKMYGGNDASYFRKERIKRSDISKDGYHTIQLCKSGDKKRFKVHRLVALAFIGNPSNKPYINHIDNNPGNNHVNNLEWCTACENVAHIIKQRRHAGVKNLPKDRRGSSINTSKLSIDQVRAIKQSTLSNAALARTYGVTRAAVRLIKIGKNWAHV